MKSKDLLKLVRESDDDKALEAVEAAMARASLKIGREQWFRLTEMVDTEHRILDIGSGDPDKKEQARPVYASGQFFDVSGELMLVAVQADMENLPFGMINQVRQVVQAQGLAPVIMFPPEVSLVRFRPISNREAKRVKARLKRQLKEAEKASADLKAKMDAVLEPPQERKLKLV
jgi:hypothetical protein